MVSDISIVITTDTTQAQASLTELEQKVNLVGQKSVEVRNQVMNDVRKGMSLISNMMSAMHIASRILRLNLQPWQQALLSLVGTTVSTMMSVAAAMSSTVVGIPAALIISSAAMGLQIGVTIEILAQMAEAQAQTAQIDSNTQASREMIRNIISGLGGM